ncbi:MAG: class I SAM-dependent methyltransferase [Bdellovibrionales bacterium]|nr:class I SAM-dependent methyltransferase [Bdellovibrionales bacterium]
MSHFTNNDFIRCWNDILVPKWNRFRHILSGNGKNHSDIAFEYANIKEGQKILDVGCGYGETCLELAEKVGSSGKVIGIDCTTSFLETAKIELAESRHKNVEYILGDAQDHPFQDESFDMAFSRFGIMFFENRVAALKNIHRSLKVGGQMMLIVWRGLEDNYCWRVGKEISLKYLTQPTKVGSTCGPGPFSMADEETCRDMLKAAGFSKIDLFKQNDIDVIMGRDIDDAIEMQLQVGPSGEIIRESGEHGKSMIPKIREDLKKELEKYQRGNEVWLPSSAWIILATKE